MKTSLFDLFKIGIGPSSSHTVGPMRAAYQFASGLAESGKLSRVARVRVDLYGSLALTGRGHGTPRGVTLGLSGERPDTVDPAAVQSGSTIPLAGSHPIPFNPETDILFHPESVLPKHSNGMRFTALDSAGETVESGVYYSIGGGFVLQEGQTENASGRASVPFPFESGEALLKIGIESGLKIHEIMLANERAWRSDDEIRAGIHRIWQTMQDCTERGLTTEGILPGGLNVRRRAPARYRKLVAAHKADLLDPMDWLNVFAMAVNEENAAGGRVVTAPTNGAAGIIPAVAHYYMRFLNGDESGLERYFLAAAAIGVLYKENASISGAEVGCQGEVGVACSMAAAGLASALNGSNESVEHAAEVGMEHNLGMTCDPIGGLVQIPCIERNAFGAVKAVNAARMALEDTAGHKVSLDQVIKTMYQTGLDMQSRYKETALGGLAVNVIEC